MYRQLAFLFLTFPHFVQGGGYQTIFTMNNFAATATTATIDFMAPSGQTISTQQVQVDGNGSARLSSPNSDISVGWARVTMDPNANLQAIETIKYIGGGEISLSPSNIGGDFRSVVADDEGGSTSLALVNTGSVSEPVTVVLRQADGTLFGSRSISLGPMQQIAGFLSELIPGSPHLYGTLEITAPDAVGAVVLRQAPSGSFSVVPTPSTNADIYFSPRGNTSARIVQEIQRATVSIDVAIYTFTRKEIADALIAAKQRGVTIRVIADSGEASLSGTQIGLLEASAISVKRTEGGGGGIMHNKYAIFDGRLMITGSYNWSTAAEDDNDENAIFLRDVTVIAAYQNNFDSIW